MDIKNFIEHATEEYQQGSFDRRVPIGDFEVQVHETEDYLSFYLEEKTGNIFNEDGTPADSSGAPSALNFTKWSFNQYCRRIKPEGAPLTADYIRDCSPKLAIHNLTTWSRVNAEKEIYARFKKSKGGRIDIRGILSGTWAPIDATYVASKLQPYLGDDPIDYAITDRYWRITRWTTSNPPYEIGFRVLGSEVGAMPHLRVDTVIGFRVGNSCMTVPILQNGRPVGKLTYNSSGAKAANSLMDAIHRGLSQSNELIDCLDQRRKEPLRYPQDEFIDISDNRKLPSSVKSAVTERTALFENVENKLDMVKLLSKLASETKGHAQIKIEEAAALYALTGRVKDRVNRNEEVWED